MNKLFKPSITLLILAPILILNIFVVRFFIADIKDVEAKSYLGNGYFSVASKLNKEALILNPNEPLYFRDNGIVYLATTISDEITKEDKDLLRQYSLLNLKTAYKLQPYNVVNMKSLIQTFGFLAIDDISNLKNPTQIQKYKNEAESFYKEVEYTSDKDASISLLLGKGYRLTGNKQKSEYFLNKTLQFKPDLIEAKEELNLLKSQTL